MRLTISTSFFTFSYRAANVSGLWPLLLRLLMTCCTSASVDMSTFVKI